MIKLVLIVLIAVLLSSSAPVPTCHTVQGGCQIHGIVEGRHRLGYIVPLGEYTAIGATLAEALANAQQRDAQIRTTATAQAAR